MKYLSYEEIEEHVRRAYGFGKDNNPVSRDCELQAIRIKMGFTGPFAVNPPTDPITEYYNDKQQTGQPPPVPR